MTSFRALFALTMFSATAYAQITITAADVPVPATIVHFEQLSPTPTPPTLGANLGCDYSSATAAPYGYITYTTETDPFFVNAGVDVRRDSVFKYVTTTLGYFVSEEYDFNANRVIQRGTSVSAAGYSLTSSTGGPTDSMIFLAKKEMLASPQILRQFPMAVGSAWQSTSSHAVDFTLSVAAYGVSHLPGQHRFTTFRSDTVAGWGTLRVHTTSGTTIPYDVLLMKTVTYSVDSFFLGGLPGPPALLTAFGLAQGQRTNVLSTLDFYRKGSFHYMMRFYYGDDSFGTLGGALVNPDGLVLSGVHDAETPAYSSMVYPNPTNGSEINVMLIGRSVTVPNYIITDMAGRTVSHGTLLTRSTGPMSIAIDAGLANGAYLLTVLDGASTVLASEQIHLQR